MGLRISDLSSRQRRGLKRSRGPLIAVAAALLVWSPAAHADTFTLDFEGWPDGQDASQVYESHPGVTFSRSHIFQTPLARPLGFSKPPARALAGWAPGDEFPSSHLSVNFASGLDTIRAEFYAGAGGGFVNPQDHVTVTATAYNLDLGLPDPGPFPGPPLPPLRVVDTAVASFDAVDEGGAAIDTLLRLETPTEGPAAGLPIHQIVISYQSELVPGAPPPVLIDDLSFQTSASVPPPPATQPPRASFRSPENGSAFGLYTPTGQSFPRAASVPFVLDVEAETAVTAVLITESGPQGTRRYFFCGSVGDLCPSAPPDYSFRRQFVNEYSTRGDYTVTATPFDALGRAGATASVSFRVVNQRLDLRASGRPINGDPVVDNFEVTVRVPSHERLSQVSLELHDNTINHPGFPNPEVPVFPRSRAISDAIEIPDPRERGLHYEYRISFPLPLWHVGVNSLLVHALTVTDAGIRHASIREAFSWSPPRENWGIHGVGRQFGTTFATEGIPIRATNCSFVFCKDADQDGLLDLWENVAVEILRPKLVFDRDEDMRNHPSHHVRNFVRVTPVSDPENENAPPLVLFRYATAYTRDYGDPGAGFDGHRGDVQSMQTLWWVDEDWAPGFDAIHLVFARANRHVGTFPFIDTSDWRREPVFLNFDESGFLKLWVEEDKHGMWWDNCEQHGGPYDCNGGREFRPAAVNAGERPRSEVGSAQRGRPFIDDLSRIYQPFFGGYGDFAGIFPGEFVWSPRGERFEFCGGIRSNETCADHIGEQALRILRDEFPQVPDDDRELVTPGQP